MTESRDHDAVERDGNMRHELEQPLNPQRESHAIPVVGGLCLVCGAVIAAVSIAQLVITLPFPMPWVWRIAPELWIGIGVVMFFLGLSVIAPHSLTSEAEAEAQPGTAPVFHSVQMMTRSNCPLCDEAKDVLDRYSSVLPPTQLVDIESHEPLVERYGHTIPVVIIDGVERFRGHVNEVLLRRMIVHAQSEL